MLVFRTNAASRLCFSMLLIALSGVCSAQEPTAEEITQRLLDWQHSFANLRIVYERRNPSQWLVRKPELADSGDIDQYYQHSEWIYTDGGNLRYATSEYEGGKLAKSLTDGIGSRVSFQASFLGESALPTALVVWPKRPAGADDPGRPMPLMELYAGHGEWIGDIFRRVTPILLRTDTIDGSPCVAIHRAADSRYTLWLDLDHDCLPRLNEPDQDINGTRFHVEEFLQLPNGRWLPQKGTSVQTKENQPYYWVVTEAEVNKQLPDSVFAPPKPGPETQLHDRAGYFGRAATPRLLPREGKTLTPNPPPPLPSGKPVTAAIPHTNWSAAIIGSVAVIVLATILGVWWTRRM